MSDITYLPFANGSWVYLCAFQDQCIKQVVSWHMGSIMPETFVTTVLQWDLLAQAPGPGRVFQPQRPALRRRLLHPALRARGPCARRAAAVLPGRASATTTHKIKACDPAAKRRCLNSASGPFLPTWPMRRPASPSILTTTTTTDCTPALLIKPQSRSSAASSNYSPKLSSITRAPRAPRYYSLLICCPDESLQECRPHFDFGPSVRARAGRGYCLLFRRVAF